MSNSARIPPFVTFAQMLMIVNRMVDPEDHDEGECADTILPVHLVDARVVRGRIHLSFSPVRPSVTAPACCLSCKPFASEENWRQN